MQRTTRAHLWRVNLGHDGVAKFITSQQKRREDLWSSGWQKHVRGEHALLAPTEPCWIMLLTYMLALLKQKVAKKELELCGTPTL